MAGLNLADKYRAAGLTPGPEILTLRQEPFDKLRKVVDAKIAVELSRMYFGLASPNSTDWFRDPFHAADNSFSMLDNKRESAVLAAALLEAAFEDGKALAAIAPLATAAFGHRKPTASPALLPQLEQGLALRAINRRRRERGDPATIKGPAKSKPADAAAFAQSLSSSWEKVAAAFNEVQESNRGLAAQVAGVIKPMHDDVADLREEVAMLWWHIGGWSRLLNAPFSEMTAATAAVLAGIDMSDLSRTFEGPVAAPAMLHRTLVAGRKQKLGKVAIKDAVDGIKDADLEKLDFGAALGTAADICPVLTALAKAREIGSGTAWHAAYKKASGMNATAEFSAVDLAVQSFRERMMLVALKSE
jgi:hypothetical protein